MIQKENVKLLRRNKRYLVKTRGCRVRKSRVRGCRKLGGVGNQGVSETRVSDLSIEKVGKQPWYSQSISIHSQKQAERGYWENRQHPPAYGGRFGSLGPKLQNFSAPPHPSIRNRKLSQPPLLKSYCYAFSYINIAAI